ncbi:flagellar biosynthetic protein FliO [Nevskia ramosa]|uniref:flagellar biosynthetic protein FliO n=1 Tax=Nevskia ramosa TaxID=64002 RepID=UPI003D1507CA
MSTAAEATMASTALPSLGQTALSLIVVLGLIFALAWLLKRVQGVRLGGPANLRIHAGLQVGPKEKVLMIEAGGQHLLIGVSAGGVNTLHVFAEAPIAPAAGSDQPQPPIVSAFSDALKRALGQAPKS